MARRCRRRAAGPPAADRRQLEDEPEPPRGIGLVQKLAFSPDGEAARRGRGRGAAAVHRAAQRADAGRRRQAADRLRRAGPVPARLRRLHRRHQRAMLAKLGCTLRHRRALRAPAVSTARTTRRRAKVAGRLRHGLVADPLRGEGLEVRRGGRARRALRRPARRRARGLDRRAGAPSVVVAYEPVWAIGTGEVATPEDAQEVCGAARAAGRAVRPATAADGVRILYGGSVKAANTAEILARARRRRRAGRRRQPGRRRVRRDLSTPPAASRCAAGPAGRGSGRCADLAAALPAWVRAGRVAARPARRPAGRLRGQAAAAPRRRAGRGKGRGRRRHRGPGPVGPQPAARCGWSPAPSTASTRQRSYLPGVWNLMRLYTRTLVTYAPARERRSRSSRTWPPTSGRRRRRPDLDVHAAPGLPLENGSPITSRDVKYGIERLLRLRRIVGGPT